MIPTCVAVEDMEYNAQLTVILVNARIPMDPHSALINEDFDNGLVLVKS